jgi:hypothetical protein
MQISCVIHSYAPVAYPVLRDSKDGGLDLMYHVSRTTFFQFQAASLSN